ncbi:MAG: hypothetical protein MUO37_08780 [Methyloceanibacter sp.]|jgi:hypothetical protein|nr:hypothetical protein [Methyloceanibacter sp.]
MRSDGIASLKEALVHAGLDSRPRYVAPQAMAERFRHRPNAKLTTNSRPAGDDHPTRVIGAMTWAFLILLLMSMLCAGAFILGKKSRAAELAPCFAEARAELLSL